MIPLRDDNPTRTTPWVNYTLIAINIAVFVIQLMHADTGALPMDSLEFIYGVKPAFLHGWLRGEPVLVDIVQLDALGRHVIVGQRWLEPAAANTLVPYLTSMLLHAGWLHIGLNLLFLWIFGDNVEEALGRRRYLLLYLASGLAGSLTHTAIEWHSTIPTIGASGAIAGVLGAYAVRFPRARVLTLVPIFFFITFLEVPALLLLGLWFALQVVQGLGPATYVASWAHAGGFVAGVALLWLLAPPRRARPRSPLWIDR
ncbi:MAG: rhomboid family intramembrane serine protease [Planctomycetota bacterium]